NAPELNWTITQGQWLVTGDVSHDGIASLQSIGPNPALQTIVNGPARLSFWTRLAGPLTPTFSFQIDGRLVLSVAGLRDWEYREFYLGAGSHTLSWSSFGSIIFTNVSVF